ncbi:MAG: PH domain-containing protein [Candidatus Micrarchaeota archaeon]
MAVEQHLNRRVMLVWAFPVLAVVAVLIPIGALYYSLTPDETLFFGFQGRLVVIATALALSLLLMASFGAWVLISYRLFTFTLADNELIIRYGVLTRHRVVIPYERIQNMNTIRSPVERLFGLVSLKFETAGAELSVTEGVLPGIAYRRAIELIEAIIARKTLINAGARRTEQQKPDLSSATLGAIFEELRLIRGLLERGQGRTSGFGERASQPASSRESFAEPSHDQIQREVERQIEELRRTKKKRK